MYLKDGKIYLCCCEAGSTACDNCAETCNSSDPIHFTATVAIPVGQWGGDCPTATELHFSGDLTAHGGCVWGTPISSVLATGTLIGAPPNGTFEESTGINSLIALRVQCAPVEVLDEDGAPTTINQWQVNIRVGCCTVGHNIDPQVDVPLSAICSGGRPTGTITTTVSCTPDSGAPGGTGTLTLVLS